jgi:hypothetical protein
MLKGVLKGRKFNSSDEIEEGITKVWDELTFDEVESVFHNWMSGLAWILENGKNILLDKYEMAFLACHESQNQSRAGNFPYTLYDVQAVEFC